MERLTRKGLPDGRQANSVAVRTIDIRAHHLVCLVGFRGLGYNKEFIENMTRVARLFHSRDTAILIIDKTDAICSACPYNRDGNCARERDSERRVRSKDLEVMRRLELRVGDKFRSDRLLGLIGERISPADITEICQGCDWLDLGYCAEGLKSLNPGAEAAKR